MTCHNKKTSILSSRYFNLASESLWTFVGNAGASIAGLMGLKLLTHVLDSAEYGQLALAGTIVGFVAANLYAPLGQGLMRFFSIAKDYDTLEEFSVISINYQKFFTYFIISLTVLIAILGLVIETGWTALLITSIFVGISTGLFDIRISVFTAARERKIVALLNTVNAFFRPIIGALLVTIIGASVNWAMAGYFIVSLLMLLIAERYYRIIIYRTPISLITFIPSLQGLSGQIFSYSWPFTIWGIFSWVHLSTALWSLQAFNGTELVGAFSVVLQLAVFPLIFGSTLLSTFFLPIAFQKVGDLKNSKNVTSARKILGLMIGMYILGAIVIVIVFAMFHNSLILLISNIHYTQFSYLLPWISASWALFYLGQLLSTFGFIVNKTSVYIAPKIVSAIIAGIGTFYLSNKIGPNGVVIGIAISGFFYMAWCAVIVWQLRKKKSYS
jgi:O-antigen/teichoic acid export membrane protein